MESMEPLTGEEIAKELGVTRQAVSNTLKRAMGKVFWGLKRINPNLDNFEIAIIMMIGLNADEYRKFFRLFPPEIKNEIKKDAEKRMGEII